MLALGAPLSQAAGITWGTAGQFIYGAEIVAGTDPADRASVFRILLPKTGHFVASSGIVLCWTGVAGRVYHVDGTTNLALGFPRRLRAGLPATPPLNTCTVETVEAGAPGFYRVDVERP